MKMRTIKEAHKELIDADPNCALTVSSLRRLISSGTIPSVKIGNRNLIDLDQIENYLMGATTM